MRNPQIMLKKAKEITCKLDVNSVKTSMSLEDPISYLLLWFAHPFRPLVSLLVKLTSPCFGWLCPKGQVTRAQEAEENYLVKRELATVKQQSEDASAQLVQAKKTIRQLQQQQQPQAVRRATESPADGLRCGQSVTLWMFPRSVCIVQCCPQAGHFMIIWCYKWHHVFSSHVSDYLSPLLSWHMLPSNKDQALAEQHFSHFLFSLGLVKWYVLACMNSNWDMEYYTVQSPCTVFCVLRNAFMNLKAVVSQAGCKLHTWCPVHRILSFLDLNLLIIDGWLGSSWKSAAITMFYIMCYPNSQGAVINYLCESERENGCHVKLRLNSL